MNKLNGIRAFAAYSLASLDAARVKFTVNRVPEPLKFTSPITSSDFRSLVSCHRGVPLKFVYHVRGEAMAIGKETDDYIAIAKVIKHPDVQDGRHENCIDGIIKVGPQFNIWPQIGEKVTKITVNGLSGPNNYRDPLEAFDFLVKLAKDNATAFNVLWQDKGNTAGKTYYYLIVEDMLS